jgi:hypothetical protein
MSEMSSLEQGIRLLSLGGLNSGEAVDYGVRYLFPGDKVTEMREHWEKWDDRTGNVMSWGFLVGYFNF